MTQYTIAFDADLNPAAIRTLVAGLEATMQAATGRKGKVTFGQGRHVNALPDSFILVEKT